MLQTRGQCRAGCLYCPGQCCFCSIGRRALSHPELSQDFSQDGFLGTCTETDT